ncbi:MAG: TonB-dependent receptor [Flavobacteriales bacterium]|nr:TonB-dependent receptor [Flavobacteriales bacterium]MDW8410695.1 TonB-dependent receptor [Flavobacteriales bacterium]
MKQQFFLFAILGGFVLTHSFAQRLQIRTFHAETGRPLSGVLITGSRSGYLGFTDAEGLFYLPAPSPQTEVFRLQLLGYRTREFRSDTVRGPRLEVALEPAPVLAQPVEVVGVRSLGSAPFPQNNLRAEELEKRNLGQDIPILLGTLPATVAGSDAGNGIGYTNLRIRGTDITRTNVTIDGVPVNDAESQGVFWVNMPDLVSSAASIQVQRGVGPSTNGPGAYGASIHISTLELKDKPYAELGATYGSFGSRRTTFKAGTGLLNDHFTADVRLSEIRSEGYIDRAWSRLNSWFTALCYYGRRTTVKASVFSGQEKTYQAWYGIPRSWADSARRANVAGTERPGTPYENETDNYRQTWYRIYLNQQIRPALTLNAGLFAVQGAGYYEQYKASQNPSRYQLPSSDTLPATDIIRQLWLKNWFYGGLVNLIYSKPALELVWGAMASYYDGIHEGRVIWSQNGFFPDNYLWYHYPAFKTDWNTYLKSSWRPHNHWELYADLQYRGLRYQIEGFRNNPTIAVDRYFHFINPKLGLTWKPSPGHRFFISAAVASKEPNRDDFEAGAQQQPRPERLIDYEAGYALQLSGIHVQLTGFYMDYYDQLVLTGRINDVGAYTRQNVKRSYRTGAELEARWVPTRWLEVSGNLHAGLHRIRRFTEYVDNYDTGLQDSVVRTKVPIALSPGLIAGLNITVRPLKRSAITLQNKYVGPQYLDNSGSAVSRLEGFYVSDLFLNYELFVYRQYSLQFQMGLYNLFNVRYAPSGYTYSYILSGQRSTDVYLYPMATFNLMGGVVLRFEKQ